MRKLMIKEISEGESNGFIKYFASNSFLKSKVLINYSDLKAGDKDSFFIWGEKIQIFDEFNPVYLNYTFDTYSISLTHYSMRGHIKSCYSKTWELYGINNKEIRLIHRGNSSSICSLESKTCDSSNSTVFTIDESISIIPFSSFVFKSEDGSCVGHHFATSGLEFFGTLYSNAYFTSSLSYRLRLFSIILSTSIMLK